MPITQDLLTKIQEYESQGYSPEEISTGIKLSPNHKDIASKIDAYEKQGYSAQEIVAGLKSSPLPGRTIQQDVPPWRYTVSKMAHEAFPLAGMMGGEAAAALTAPITTPAGVMALSVPLAGVGYSIGESAARAVDIGLGVPSSGQGIRQSIQDIGTGAIYEVAGGLVGAGVSKVLAPTAKALYEGEVLRPEAKKLFDLYEKQGYKPLPSEARITPSKTLGILESVLGYSPFSGDVLLKKSIERMNQMELRREELIARKAPNQTIESVGKEIRKEASDILSRYTRKKGEELQAMVEEFAGKYGLESQYKAGETFGKIMEQDRSARVAKVRGLYQQTENLLPGKGKDVVPLSSETTAAAQKLYDDEMAKSSPLRDKKVISLLRDILPKAAEKEKMQAGFGIIVQKEKVPAPKTMTWQGIDKSRSVLLQRIRSILRKEGENTTESHVYSILESALDRDMASYAEKQGGDIWETFSQAREAARTTHELYDKDMLKIMQKNPEDILNRVVSRGEVTLLRQIKSSVGDKGLVPLRRAFFKKALDEATERGVISPLKLQKNIIRYGEETLNELTTTGQREALRGIVDRGIFIQNKMGTMKTIDFLETITGSSIERVVPFVSKNRENARIARAILPAQKIKDIASEYLATHVFKKSGSGFYLPVSSAKQFSEHAPALRELLGVSRFKEVEEFIQSGTMQKRVEDLARNSSQTGQVFVGFETGRGLLTHPLRTSLGLFLGRTVAKIYTSDAALAYFKAALRLSPTSQEAISLFSKAAQVALGNQAPQPYGEEAKQ